MPSAFEAARRMIAAMLDGRTSAELDKRSRPDTATPLKPWIRPAKHLEPVPYKHLTPPTKRRVEDWVVGGSLTNTHNHP